MTDDERDDLAEEIMTAAMLQLFELGFSGVETGHIFIGCGVDTLRTACCERSLANQLAIVGTERERIRAGDNGELH